jgi:hypothetical protein
VAEEEGKRDREQRKKAGAIFRRHSLSSFFELKTNSPTLPNSDSHRNKGQETPNMGPTARTHAKTQHHNYPVQPHPHQQQQQQQQQQQPQHDSHSVILVTAGYDDVIRFW